MHRRFLAENQEGEPSSAWSEWLLRFFPPFSRAPSSRSPRSAAFEAPWVCLSVENSSRVTPIERRRRGEESGQKGRASWRRRFHASLNRPRWFKRVLDESSSFLYSMALSDVDRFFCFCFFFCFFLMNDCVKSRIAKTRAVKRSFSVLKRGWNQREETTKNRTKAMETK